MKVKLKNSVVIGAGSSIETKAPGSVIDLDDKVAKTLIAKGVAEQMIFRRRKKQPQSSKRVDDENESKDGNEPAGHAPQRRDPSADRIDE